MLLLLLDGHAGHFVGATGSLSRPGNLERCAQKKPSGERCENPKLSVWSWVASYLGMFPICTVCFLYVFLNISFKLYAFIIDHFFFC